ncbi:MAG TPA: BTAD domain-containing putative transcriptional regulator, partial [Deinococcales bacterium]|nr:BTAD domain-containing putative transcriptional regulator [Deinococcales bacterium]
MLELLFLGPAQVRVNGEAAAFKTRKALVLLAYLALEGGAQGRDRLAGLFWPDSEPEAGRASLRNTLVYLREGLGEAADRLHADRSSVSLRLQPGDWLDVRELEEAARAVRPGVAVPADGGRLGDAARLAGGEFLLGVEVEEGELDEWLSARRSQARRWTEMLLSRLIQSHMEAGDFPAAVEAAERWVTLDNTSEEAWRSLASAHHAAGQRSAAREALRECRRVLQEELGATPAPET